jgi:hypothetical protein
VEHVLCLKRGRERIGAEGLKGRRKKLWEEVQTSLYRKDKKGGCTTILYSTL